MRVGLFLRQISNLQNSTLRADRPLRQDCRQSLSEELGATQCNAVVSMLIIVHPGSVLHRLGGRPDS